MPLAFGGVYFLPNERGESIAVLFFYGGPNRVFIRKYPKLVLQGIREGLLELRDMGGVCLYALADKTIEKSEDFLRRLGGEPLEGHEQPEGRLFAIQLANCPLIRSRE